MITVAESCVGCGLCVPVCPHGLFVIEQGSAKVVDGDCLACGHCQAACPHGAIALTGAPLQLGLHHVEERLTWLGWGKSDAAAVVQLMRSSRSCRNYREKEVEQSLLEDLVKIGTTAPSGTNSQGWTFSLAASRSEVLALGELTARFYQGLNRKAANPFWRFLARLLAGNSLERYYRRYYESVQAGLLAWQERGEDHLFHGAPAAILVGGKKSASCPAEDSLLSTQNILLAAHGLGLGSCLIGFVVEAIKRDRSFQRHLQLTDEEAIYAVIALGYPAESYQTVTPRQPITPRYLQLARMLEKK